MCRIMLTAALIALSVISRCDSAPGQFDSLDKTALDLFKNIQNKFEVQIQNREVSAGLCWLCKATVGNLMALASQEIKKEIKAMCKTFQHFKQNCLHQASKYEAMAIRLLFHGKNARDSCKHMHFC